VTVRASEVPDVHAVVVFDLFDAEAAVATEGTPLPRRAHPRSVYEASEGAFPVWAAVPLALPRAPVTGAAASPPSVIVSLQT
jgi:hypothetical protein